MGGHLLLQGRVGLRERAVFDLQYVDDAGQELRLSAQIVAFGADAGQVLLLLGRAGPGRVGQCFGDGGAGLDQLADPGDWLVRPDDGNWRVVKASPLATEEPATPRDR